jgi:hypothetical protein
VAVPYDGRPCCGEVEARRTNHEQPEAFVRCVDEAASRPEECSGWFAWGEVDVIEVRDVSGHARHRA